MSDAENFGDESGQENPGDAGSRTEQVRAQAQLAWNRVQHVLDRDGGPALSSDSILSAVDQLPRSTFVAIIGGSLAISAVLQSLGRRTAADRIGILGPVIAAAGLLLKATREQPSGSELDR